MQSYHSTASRIAASVSAFAITMFLIAVSFAPPGTAVAGSGLVA